MTDPDSFVGTLPEEPTPIYDALVEKLAANHDTEEDTT